MDDLNVACPWCDTLNTIPEQLLEESRASIVRSQEASIRINQLQYLTRGIRKRISKLFEPQGDANDWIDIHCNSTSNKKLGLHSFQLNIRTKEVRR